MLDKSQIIFQKELLRCKSEKSQRTEKEVSSLKIETLGHDSLYSLYSRLNPNEKYLQIFQVLLLSLRFDFDLQNLYTNNVTEESSISRNPLRKDDQIKKVSEL